MGPMHKGRLFVRTEDGVTHEFTDIEEINFEAGKPKPRKEEGITISISPYDPDYVDVVDHATGNKRCVRYHIDKRHSFDFYEEALYALRRYCENNFNMKVVCTESDGDINFSFIPGKVYEIKNGLLIGPNGYRHGCYTSLNDLNNYGVLGRHCQFIEFKGEA